VTAQPQLDDFPEMLKEFGLVLDSTQDFKGIPEAYGTTVDQVSLLRWPEEAQFLDAGKELDRILRPAHAMSALPSNDATRRVSAPRKTQTASLVS